ncbi:MAG: FAD-binding oxidoreductase, partial [Pseudomonadota bacterium]
HWRTALRKIAATIRKLEPVAIKFQHADFIIIGGGIAGVSLGAWLVENHSVILLEAEEMPGYHSTGRSAAVFASAYGNGVIQTLTAPGEDFYLHPPTGFTDVELLIQRGSIFIARENQLQALDSMAEEIGRGDFLSVDDIIQQVPIVNRDYAARGMLLENDGALDVDAILQGFLKQFKAQGGQLETRARVDSLERTGNQWLVKSQGAEYSAAVVVNAAGAWADEIATLAGLGPLGMQPLRRTAILLDAPTEFELSHCPQVIDIDEQFYFKPDAGVILASPADETPSPPCDVQPDELDVAMLVDKLEQVTVLDIQRVNHQWAGLRTFAPDRTPVAGFDPRTEGFFWLAGQGGYGIQTAPGLSQLAAYLVADRALPGEFAPLSKLAPDLSPQRLLK